MPTTGATTGGTHEGVATASGARIAPISADGAEALLARLNQHGPGTVDLALGAIQDDGSLIGVAVLGNTASGPAPAMVAVVPARRRLKIGSDLLHALAAEAARLDVRRLQITYPIDTPAADALIRSSGLVTARRTGNGTVTAIMLVPGRR